MGVTSEILLDKPNGGVHRPGQIVSGTIRYTIDKPTKYQDIVLSLVGKGECAWSEINYFSVYASRMYVGRENYVTVHNHLLDKRGANSIIVPNGTYEYKFQFTLPKNIPPSYNDVNCTITYKVKLKFIKVDSIVSIKKFYATIPVLGTIETNEPKSAVIYELNKPVVKPFSSKYQSINFKAEINGAPIKPGDEAKVSFVVTNDTDVTISRIKIEVICFTKYTANCGSTKSKTTTVKEVIAETPSISAKSVANLSNVIKTLPDMYSIHSSKIISREYKIKAILKLPVPYGNCSLLIPIMMAAREDEEPAAIDDELPLYWEVMKN